jgi:4'-phosphopantetheinyl transferase EntD
VQALGIDAERRAPLPAGVLQLVCTASEREHLDRLGRATTGPP